MLPKHERLKKNFEFKKVYQGNNYTVSNLITMHYTPKQVQNSHQYPKVGFVVSKKFANRSVKRNQMKRKMRHAYSALKNSRQDIVVQLKSIIFTARIPQEKGIVRSYQDVLYNMEACLARVTI